MRLREDGSLDLTPIEHFRWAWGAGTLGVGILLVGLAIVADNRWQWVGIWPSVFLEGGMALALLAVLAYFERRLVRTVASAADAAYCTLGEPPTLIARVSPFGSPDRLACGHRNPNHSWDVDTGRRLPDRAAPTSRNPPT